MTFKGPFQPRLFYNSMMPCLLLRGISSRWCI